MTERANQVFLVVVRVIRKTANLGREKFSDSLSTSRFALRDASIWFGIVVASECHYFFVFRISNRVAFCEYG